ncbi:MAG: helix-turn-helix domain-containing protein [Lachnospiraceae bacterium]|nr:helix-turn-helix domain-containing protein [Lachnospiraceae bacterium]
MITNQILQGTIDGLKAITGVDMCLCDTDGKRVAASGDDNSFAAADVVSFAKSQADSQEVKGKAFFKVHDEDGQLEYILITDGGSDDSYTVGKITVFQIKGLLTAYRERYDKDNFIKNLLLDNLLLVDIYNRAKKLHIETEDVRAVMLVETRADKNSQALELVRKLFAGRTNDFVTAVDEKYIILVLEVDKDDAGRIELKTADSLIASLHKEGFPEARISYGTPVDVLKDVSRSYKEAKMALDVGKIFFDERDIIAYGSLGIGRLIYQLPIPLCKMFIKEIFAGKSPEDFDEETLTTIDKFFENSLNVSETSRQLFIHRNTLVYRLDKLQKATGLDLRVFEDAITFKIALMVSRYMKYMENNNY